MAAGGATPTQGDEVMGFVQAWIRVAAEPSMVDTVESVANVFPAAHTPVMVAFQNLCAGFASRLSAHGGYCS